MDENTNVGTSKQEEELLQKISKKFLRGGIKNDARSIRLQKAAAKRQRQDARRKLRERLGDAAPPKEQPKTIENLREDDVTMVEFGDEEIEHDEANDEMSSYFNRENSPKVLITTSPYAKVNTFKFCYELQKCIPDAEVFTRKGLPIKKVIKQAKTRDYTDVIIVHEDGRMPNGIVLCHLPDGPTAFFKINSLKFTKDIKKAGESTEHFPEVILNNFNTRLGHIVARMFASLFPHDPMFKGRRVVTFHNQRDYIFFRHHRYEFKRNGEKAALQELGPRFTLRLKWLQRGTFDTRSGEYEWVLKGVMAGRSRMSGSSSSQNLHHSIASPASVPQPTSTTILTSPARRSFFSLIFNRHKEEVKSYVSSEGSITHQAWQEMGRESSLKTRLAAIEQLRNLVRGRRLQVSTLEAIYHETRDLLESGEEGEEPVLQMLISMTESQIEQIGLALRATFFREICRLGLSDLTLKWLIALTKDGEKVVGIEYAIVLLLRDWINIVLDMSTTNHPQAILVLQFAQQLIRWNAGFLREQCLDEITHKVCERVYCKTDDLTYECLKLLDTILKFGHIPDKKLLTLVTTLCSLVNRSEIGKEAWALMRDLLRSRSGHRTLVSLIRIIGNSKSYNDQKIVVGAVSIVTMALWGNQRVETLRCQPTAVLPAMTVGMEASPRVMKEVFISLKRLLTKYGRNLQQLSWHSVIQLLNRALSLCKQMDQDVKDEKCTNLKQDLHQLINIIEDFYREGEFAGSVEAMYALIERCAEERRSESIVALIDYKAACIDPLGEKWLRKMAQLIDRYLNSKSSSSLVREKAICLLHSMYTKYHYLYEKDVVIDLIVPVLGEALYEEDVKLQYQMLNVLFDVAKTTTLRTKGDQDCFAMIMEILKTFLSEEALKQVHNDNIEVVASGIAEIMQERFVSFSLTQLQMIVEMQCKHLHLHYTAESTTEIGSEIRDRMFSSLLSLLYDPLYDRLIKKAETVLVNPRICCHGRNLENCFTWQPICEVTILALQRERWSPVLKTVLRHLSELLEIREFVFTAGEVLVRNLNDALVNLFMRRADLLFESESNPGKAEETVLTEKRNDNVLAKFYCPAITKLINYFRDERICYVLVDSIDSSSGHSGCKQAILGCDVAMQVMPKNMAQLVRRIMTNLSALKPNPILAIPIIEFLSDASSVEEFYRFFQLNHFVSIVNILLPYANIHRFNTYIIAAVIRVLMLWYSKMPEDVRDSVSKNLVKKIESQEVFFAQCYGSLSRQTSEDSSRVPPGKDGLLVPSISSFSSEVSPDSPPPAHGAVSATPNRFFCTVETGGREKIAEEATDLLVAFLRHGKIDDVDDTQKLEIHEGLVEKNVQHWIVNDSIISVTILAEPEFIQTTTSTPALSGTDMIPPRQVSETLRTDKRRRHLSATNASENSQPMLKPASLDDSYAMKNQVTVTFSAIGNVTWTHLVVRHMLGKHSWLMRSFCEIPDDFEAVPSSIADTNSLILHLCANKNAIKVTNTDKNKMMRSLRNLDRICPYEMLTVGVVYIRDGQVKEADILANSFGSSKYNTFISMLGEPQSLENNPGGLVPVQNGAFTYVYTDVISKIVFHIATLMPQKEGDAACNEKKKFIGNDYITIVFNESGIPYKLGTIAGKFAYAAIEVIPQDEINVLIKLSVRREVSSWLALSRVFLPLNQAASIVRKLALRSQLAVNIWRREEVEKGPPYLGFSVERLRYIRNFAQSHAKQTTVSVHQQSS